MFRMRVKEINTLNNELEKKVSEVVINLKNSKFLSLEKFSEQLDSVDKSFWEMGTCRLNVRVTSNNSEAVIDIGDNFKFIPNLENLFFLEDIFGKDILEI